MPKVVKGNLSGLILQPNWSLLYKQDGSIQGRCVFKCPASDGIGNIPPIGTPHPKKNDAKSYDAELVVTENEIAVITVDYIGLHTPQPYQIEYIGTVGEEPIETHPKFVSSIGGTAASPKNNAKFDAETGEFIGFPADAPNKLGGVRGYLAPSSVVRVSYYTASALSGLSDLGEKQSPPYLGFISIGGSKNWLKTNWSRRDFGTFLYQITEEYTLSGKDGWNTLIYEN